ncbi:MAG TPA: amidohydrolase family protein [Candidatus Acidoferrum sp.]|nr:amidohydrolase family protein [Candidatus Acidoferrum sp.]
MPASPCVDCHAHIIAPAQFPYSEGPGYKPRPDEVGDREAFAKVLAAHAVSHAVLVQPSCYGYDNAAMLDAMRAGGGRIKGVAVVPADISDQNMRRLKDQGVVGIRLNLMRTDPDALARPGSDAFLARVKAFDWFVQVYATGDVWAGVEAPLRRSGVRVLVDDFGDPDMARGLDQPGFQAVLRLGRDTDAAVKLSAAYRPSGRPFPHEDVEPFIAAAIGAYGVERCVWGSDWPFINTTQRVEYGSLLSLLPRWLPDPEDRRQVLWKTPARLFGLVES